MKAFTFRLEPILTMREGIRKSALGAYAHSIQKCNALEKEISNLKKDLLFLQNDISKQRAKLFSPSIDLPNQASVLSLEDQINSKCQNLQKAKDDENLKRKQFLEADNSLKSVVRLKEKQQTAHIEDQLSKEDLEMEEIINSRFNFNSNLKIKNEY